MSAPLINLVIALLWLWLNNAHTMGTFSAGYLLGFGLLYWFRPLLPGSNYVRRCLALGRFGWRFIVALARAGVEVGRAILSPDLSGLRPGFIEYEVQGLSPFEIVLLSHCLTLTPGSTAVEILPGRPALLLHFLDLQDPARVRAELDRAWRDPILAITR